MSFVRCSHTQIIRFYANDVPAAKVLGPGPVVAKRWDLWTLATLPVTLPIALATGVIGHFWKPAAVV